MVDKVSVIVVDDEVLVRQGIASLLQDCEWIDVVAQFSDVATLLKRVLEIGPDIVLIKANMVRSDSNQTMHSIRAASPDSQFILMLDQEPDSQATLKSSINVGARAVLSRRFNAEDLLACIRIVANGGVVFATSSVGDMFDDLWFSLERKQRTEKSVWHDRTIPRALADTELSEREFEVLTLLAEGSTNRQIAEILCISENTAKTHVRNILEKLQLQSRTHAAAYAIRRGFVRDEEADEPISLAE